jgi:hypothetical protein
MAYNESAAARIRKFFKDRKISFTEKKMFSGVCFMIDDKMCCGTHIDKNSGEDFLLCRLGIKDYERALLSPGVVPMEMSGKAMNGYIFVKEKGHSSDIALSEWLQQCLDFNPMAKSSKKKK